MRRGLDTPLSENSMDVDPVTQSHAVALLGYEAMIGREFEKCHGWHVNLMPSAVLGEMPADWMQRASRKQYGLLGGAGSLDGRSAGAQIEARVKFPLSSAVSKAPDFFIRRVQRGRPSVDRRGYGRPGSPLSGQSREGHGNKAVRRPRGGFRLPQHRFGGQNLHLGYLDQTWCCAIFRRRK